MEVGQALENLKTAGATLTLEGEQIHVAYRCRACDLPLLKAAITVLKEHKQEAIAFLSSKDAIHSVARQFWPPESLEAAERFRHWSARLYPFIGQAVRTPKGMGQLVQVFSDRATVLLDSERTKPKSEQRVSFFDPHDICAPDVM
jgi:hypothetical protein